MLLLPIAALALMAFFLILVMMSIATTCEQRERRRMYQSRERMFQGMNMASFNENARLVWATQLPLLQYLAANSAGVPADGLRPRYAAMAQRYPALYEGRKLEDWLQFAEETRVVCRREGRVQLTGNGRSLLEQCHRGCRQDSQHPSWPA